MDHNKNSLQDLPFIVLWLCFGGTNRVIKLPSINQWKNDFSVFKQRFSCPAVA